MENKPKRNWPAIIFFILVLVLGLAIEVYWYFIQAQPWVR